MSTRQIVSSVSSAIAVLLALLIPPQAAFPQGASAVLGSKPQDERLKQTVTTRVVDEPLHTWLDHLGQETAVRLKVAPDYEDRAITVRVRAMPLRELMEA